MTQFFAPGPDRDFGTFVRLNFQPEPGEIPLCPTAEPFTPEPSIVAEVVGLDGEFLNLNWLDEDEGIIASGTVRRDQVEIADYPPD